MTRKDPFTQLLAFLERLDNLKMRYQMRRSRDDAIMVVVRAPGQYWEVEFLQDGEVEIERYRSNGEIEDEPVLSELFDLCSSDEDAYTALQHHDTHARN